MNMKKKGLLLGLLGLVSFSPEALSQNEADVQRYSSNYFFGSARFNALGGAMGALGGDLSSAHINPAAVGVFRFSEFTFTPAVEVARTTAGLEGTSTSQFIDRLVINNMGLLLAFETRNPKWKAANFGLSYTRLASFNDFLRTDAQIPYERSLANDLLNEAQGVSVEFLDDFSAGLAWDTEIIDNPGGGTLYVGQFGPGDIIRQTHTAERRGRIGETSLAFGGNYDNVFYIGASLNFQNVRYDQTTEITESQVSPATSDLTSYTFRDELRTTGLGVNFKIGAMARIGNTFRLGAAVHTPTTLSLRDSYFVRATSRFVNPVEVLQSSAQGFFDYRVRTPWRYMASAAAVVGTKGLLTAQYEFSNFQQARLMAANRNGSNAIFSDANQVVSENFSGQNVLRFGAEIRANKNIFLRGGYAWFQNPIPVNEALVSDPSSLSRDQWSGGIGYRKASWSVDLSYQVAMVDETYLVNGGGSVAIISQRLSAIALSMNIRL
jgi:hypothetical protein